MTDSNNGSGPELEAGTHDGEASGKAATCFDADASLDLGRLVRELRRDGVIAPSRQFMGMVHEELATSRQLLEMEEAALELPPRLLLTSLVRAVVEYCRGKLLAVPKEAPTQSPTPDGTPTSGLEFTTELCVEEQVAILLEECAKAYAQLLLVATEVQPAKKRSDASPPRPAAKSESNWESLTVESPRQIPPRSLEEPRSPLGFNTPQKSPRNTKVLRTSHQHVKGAKYCTQLFSGRSSKQCGGTPIIRKGTMMPGSKKGSTWYTSTVDAGSGTGPTVKHTYERVLAKPPAHVKTTPFFEAVYALATRASQQVLRQAVELPKGQDKDRAQIALRVEEELAIVFRSHDFGRLAAGSCGRRGGARGGAITARSEEESAQLAAKAEEKIQSLLRQATQRDKEWKAKIDALEATVPTQLQMPSHDAAQFAPDRAAQKGDAAAADAPSKEEADPAATEHIDVDAVISRFRQNAAPRTRRAGGDKLENMRHVSSLRSPIMSALLPSPRDQALRALSSRSPGMLSPTLRGAATQSLQSPRSGRPEYSERTL